MKDFERTTRRLFTQCRKACGALAITAIVSMSLVSTMAFGGQVITTTIIATLAISTNVMLVYTANNSSGTPACAAGTPNGFAINGNDKYLVASVLTAQASGKTVDVYGTGTCTIWGGTENMIYFMMH